MITTVHPFFLIAGAGIIAALIVGILCFRVASIVRRFILLFVALVCVAPAGVLIIAICPELVDARFQTYKAFYRDIREGMNRSEIDALLARHYPSNGGRKRPMITGDTPERLGFFMNPETSREPNCEGIFLTLHDGRVIRKDYSPD